MTAHSLHLKLVDLKLNALCFIQKYLVNYLTFLQKIASIIH